MTVPPLTHPAASAPLRRRSTDWQHGGAAHPHLPIDSGGDGRPASFLSQALSAQAGVAMLGLGLVVVAVGSCAMTALQGDGPARLAVLLGAGIGGLTIAVVGGFLYAGSWIACLVEDNRTSNRRLAETLFALADVTAQAAATSTDVGSLHVSVGRGTVLHRRDCPLVAYRPDLVPADLEDEHLSHCRVCTR